MTTQTTIKNSDIAFRPSQIKKIFDLSLNLADLAEELLEGSAQYSKEFIKGIRKSEKDFKAGRIKKIKSFRDLLKD